MYLSALSVSRPWASRKAAGPAPQSPPATSAPLATHRSWKLSPGCSSNQSNKRGSPRRQSNSNADRFSPELGRAPSSSTSARPKVASGHVRAAGRGGYFAMSAAFVLDGRTVRKRAGPDGEETSVPGPARGRRRWSPGGPFEQHVERLLAVAGSRRWHSALGGLADLLAIVGEHPADDVFLARGQVHLRRRKPGMAEHPLHICQGQCRVFGHAVGSRVAQRVQRRRSPR